MLSGGNEPVWTAAAAATRFAVALLRGLQQMDKTHSPPPSCSATTLRIRSRGRPADARIQPLRNSATRAATSSSSRSDDGKTVSVAGRRPPSRTTTTAEAPGGSARPLTRSPSSWPSGTPSRAAQTPKTSRSICRSTRRASSRAWRAAASRPRAGPQGRGRAPHRRRPRRPRRRPRPHSQRRRKRPGLPPKPSVTPTRDSTFSRRASTRRPRPSTGRPCGSTRTSSYHLSLGSSLHELKRRTRPWPEARRRPA